MLLDVFVKPYSQNIGNSSSKFLLFKNKRFIRSTLFLRQMLQKLLLFWEYEKPRKFYFFCSDFEKNHSSSHHPLCRLLEFYCIENHFRKAIEGRCSHIYRKFELINHFCDPKNITFYCF